MTTPTSVGYTPRVTTDYSPTRFSQGASQQNYGSGSPHSSTAKIPSPSPPPSSPRQPHFVVPVKQLEDTSFEDGTDDDDDDLVVGQNGQPIHDHSTWLGRAKARAKANTGLLLIAASQAFFSLVNVAVKKLNSIDPPVSALQLIVVRMGITYFCCMTYMLLAKVEHPFLGPPGVRVLLVFRGFTGFFGLFGVYYSLQYLSLSDATVLTFLSPMCTAVTGALLLGETFTKRQALAGVVSLLGVVLIARPASLFGSPSNPELQFLPGTDAAGTPVPGGDDDGVTPSQRLLAVCIAMIGVLGATGAYTTLRAIGKRAHPLHALTSFSIQCVLVSSIAMIVKHEPVIVPTKPEWLAMLAMIGIFGFLAQVLLTMGLQRETASRGSMAVYTQIVFATIFERVFFHIKPSLLSAVGTTLIISSAVYVALSKKPDEKSTSEPAVHLRRVSEDGGEEGLLDIGVHSHHRTHI